MIFNFNPDCLFGHFRNVIWRTILVFKFADFSMDLEVRFKDGLGAFNQQELGDSQET